MNILTSKTNIDFTPSNIRNVVIWIIKNANKYYEEQMLEVYDDFTTEEGIKLYKSNKRFNDDTWRYNRHNDKDLDKYSLDYRIVKHGYLSDYDKEYRSNISEQQQQAIRDIKIIAKNLQFTISSRNINTRDIRRKEKENLFFEPESNRLLKKGNEKRWNYLCLRR
jgi:hypothetical protein